MKILYAVQGTGNGHTSRAREIIPFLKKFGELDVLVSGTQSEVDVNYFVKYRLKGFGFVFGENGGVDFGKTWNEFDVAQFVKDCKNLLVHQYDLVINDFEPVSAWSCKFKRKKCISLSHQAAYLSDKTPQLKGFHWGKMIMNNYAPVTYKVAFHFQKYDDFIHFPVIRSEIRNLEILNEGFYVVYLPAYSDEFILKETSKHPNIQWKIFSKHSKNSYKKDNAEIFPIDNQKFQEAFAKCTGLLTGGGFEGPAEALYLRKKLLSVPMKNQYEQQCNALALEQLGVPVIWHESEFSKKLNLWLNDETIISVNYPDETEKILENLIRKHS